MLYDKDIREPLFDFLEEQYGKCRMIEEKIMGRSRADIVMITEDSFYGIEIKSDRDSYVRLPRQLKDYEKFFDYNYIVVGSSHGLHIEEHVPEHWGIIVVEEVEEEKKQKPEDGSGRDVKTDLGQDRSPDLEQNVDADSRAAVKQGRKQSLRQSRERDGEQGIKSEIEENELRKVLQKPRKPNLDFYLLRKPKENPNLHPELKLGLLWRPELANIQERCEMPAYKRMSKKNLVKKILDYVDYDKLRIEMSGELFERDYTKIQETIEAYREAEGKSPKRKRKSGAVTKTGAAAESTKKDRELPTAKRTVGTAVKKRATGLRRRKAPNLLVSKVVRGKRKK